MTTNPTTGPAVPPVTEADWEAVGRQAFLNGEHSAPALNATVMAALDGMPVGGGGADIMRAFSRGWTAANLAAPVPGVDEEIRAALGGSADGRPGGAR